MKDEYEHEERKTEMEFKNLVFANNPKLYKHMFIDKPQQEMEMAEFQKFENLADIQQALAELAEAGGPELQFTFDPDEADFSVFDRMKEEEERESKEAGEVDPYDALSDQDE